MKKFKAGSNERLMADKLAEIAGSDHPGVTYLDFAGTAITEENIDAVIASVLGQAEDSQTAEEAPAVQSATNEAAVAEATVE